MMMGIVTVIVVVIVWMLSGEKQPGIGVGENQAQKVCGFLRIARPGAMPDVFWRKHDGGGDRLRKG